VRTAARPAVAADAPAAGAVVLVGLGFLLLRPSLDGLGPGARAAVLAASYLGLTAAGIGVAGIGVPGARVAGAGAGGAGTRGARGAGTRGAGARGPAATRPAAPLGAWITLGAGLAVVLAVAVLGGPAPPLPAGAAALALSVLAAVGEEALFRGVLYGWIERLASNLPGVVPAALAIAGSAAVFAAVHLPSYGPAAFPVDLGAGLLLGWQRWASGSWTVPAATHAAANLLAVILR
jgi:membrane protease YdiL (CAAX protease family)